MKLSRHEISCHKHFPLPSNDYSIQSSSKVLFFRNRLVSTLQISKESFQRVKNQTLNVDNNLLTYSMAIWLRLSMWRGKQIWIRDIFHGNAWGGFNRSTFWERLQGNTESIESSLSKRLSHGHTIISKQHAL